MTKYVSSFFSEGAFIISRSLLMLIHAFSEEQGLWIVLYFLSGYSETVLMPNFIDMLFTCFGLVVVTPYLSELLCHFLDGCLLRYESQKWRSIKVFFSAFKQITLNRTIMHYVGYCSIG